MNTIYLQPFLQHRPQFRVQPTKPGAFKKKSFSLIARTAPFTPSVLHPTPRILKPSSILHKLPPRSVQLKAQTAQPNDEPLNTLSYFLNQLNGVAVLDRENMMLISEAKSQQEKIVINIQDRTTQLSFTELNALKTLITDEDIQQGLLVLYDTTQKLTPQAAFKLEYELSKQLFLLPRTTIHRFVSSLPHTSQPKLLDYKASLLPLIVLHDFIGTYTPISKFRLSIKEHFNSAVKKSIRNCLSLLEKQHITKAAQSLPRLKPLIDSAELSTLKRSVDKLILQYEPLFLDRVKLFSKNSLHLQTGVHDYWNRHPDIKLIFSTGEKVLLIAQEGASESNATSAVHEYFGSNTFFSVNDFLQLPIKDGKLSQDCTLDLEAITVKVVNDWTETLILRDQFSSLKAFAHSMLPIISTMKILSIFDKTGSDKVTVTELESIVKAFLYNEIHEILLASFHELNSPALAEYPQIIPFLKDLKNLCAEYCLDINVETKASFLQDTKALVNQYFVVKKTDDEATKQFENNIVSFTKS